MFKRLITTICICFITSLIFSGERSSDWSKVRKQHLKIEPVCQICGTAKSLQVHHIQPFHYFPNLELEQSNLITVCTSRYWGFNCHFDVAHAGNFRYYNPWLKEDIIHIKKLVEETSDKTLLGHSGAVREYLSYIHIRTKKFNDLIAPVIQDTSMKEGNVYNQKFYDAIESIKNDL